MRTRIAALPLLALLAAAAPAQPVASTAPAPLHPDTAAAIDRVFARYSTRTPGCAVGVARGGREIFARGYGMADLEQGIAIRPTTVFEAGSVSKQFTAFLALRLEQEGRLSLDDPLRTLLPELPDYGAPLTIRQVLGHTSGLRDWYGVAAAHGLVPYEHHFRNADLLEMASRQRTLNFPSGTEHLYSNTGWNLMAIALERAGGASFQELARTRVFGPIGMTSTRWRDDFRTVVPGRAPAYAPGGAPGEWQHQMPLMSIVGAGGLLTTVHDLLRWNEDLTSGAVGGAELGRRMATRTRLASGREVGYGLGLSVGDARGTPEVSHGGATGGYRTYLARFPERGLSIAVLCNEAGADASGYANAVADAFLGAAPARSAARAMDEAELRAARGLYRNARIGTPVEVTLRDGRAQVGAQSLSILRRTGDAASALLLVSPAGDSVVLERVERWAPRADALRALEGEYASDEVLGAWRAAVAGDTLVLHGPNGRRVALRPVYQDVFLAPGTGGHVRFHRDRAGRATAVSFLLGRTRDLRLERQGR